MDSQERETAEVVRLPQLLTCPKCGQGAEEGTRYCPNCGASMKGAVATTSSLAQGEGAERGGFWSRLFGRRS